MRWYADVLLQACCPAAGLHHDHKCYSKLFSIAGIKHLLMLDENEQLKITSTGLKLFERQDAKVNLLHHNALHAFIMRMLAPQP